MLNHGVDRMRYVRKPSFLGGRYLFLFLFGALGLGASGAVQAQTFLEKLESAVRQRLEEPRPSSDEDVLPAPNASQEPAGELPSILEIDPFVPPPLETAPADPSPQADPPQSTGPVYLGLEAEQPVSGGGLGVRVTSVSEGSPAWKAGFRVGDRILAVNGFAIAGVDAMATQLGKTVPGESVQFLVSREGRNRQLTAVLLDPNLARRIAGAAEASAEGGPAWLGVTVNDLTASFREQFGIGVFRGAAVTNVTANSPAAKAGIRAGDAIIELSGQPIESARDLMAWLANARPGEKVDVMLYRGTNQRTARLDLEVVPGRALKPSSPAVAVPREVVADDPQVIIAALEAEVARLQAQLQDANRRLAETQNRLVQVLEALEN